MSELLRIPARQTTPIRELLEKERDDGTFGVPDFTGAVPHLTIWDGDDGILFDKDGAFETPVTTGIASVTPDGTMAAPSDPASPTEATRQWRVTYQDGSVDYFPADARARTLIYRTLDSE